MKVLQRTIEFCKQHPKVENEIKELGAIDGVGHDEYMRFTIQWSEDSQPELTKYLRNCGIEDDELILVEFA